MANPTPPQAFDPTTIKVPGPFAVSFSIPIPEAASKAQRQPSLPYEGYFEAYEEAAKLGTQPHFFIPVSFYMGRAGVNEDKLKPSYVKTKVREAFKRWKEKEESRSALYLTIVNREGTDEGTLAMAKAMGIEPEPGVSVWVLKGA